MRSRRRQQDTGAIDLTPMIDVVFQLIIFFIVTVRLDSDQINENIRLAQATDGPKVEHKPPIIIEVDRRGRISIGGVPLGLRDFTYIIKGTIKRLGSEIPIFIRGDKDATHRQIRRVMDICTANGLYKVQFAALKQKAKHGRR